MNHHHTCFDTSKHCSFKKKALTVLAGIAIGIGFALLFGLLVQTLWNMLIPSLFSGPAVTYLQAVGLVILSKLLFGSFHPHRDHGHHPPIHHGLHNGMPHPGHPDIHNGMPHPGNADRWEAYTRFWDEQGRDAFEAYTKQHPQNTDQ